MNEAESNTRGRRVEDALLDQIMKHRSQCLSQASYTTRNSINNLRCARDRLVEQGLIRRVARHQDVDPNYASYEINV